MPARNKTPTKSKSPRKTKEKVVEEKAASNDDHMDDDEELADGVDPLDDDLDGDYVANEEEESESDDQESQVIIVMYVTLSIYAEYGLRSKVHLYSKWARAHRTDVASAQCATCPPPAHVSCIRRFLCPSGFRLFHLVESTLTFCATCRLHLISL